MNCLDCQTEGREHTAVAVCAVCGAGVCADHAHIDDLQLTKQSPGGMSLGGMVNLRVPVTPTARIVRCRRCAAAHAATQRHGDPAARPAGRAHPRRHSHPVTSR
jgi:hypothetical protein